MKIDREELIALFVQLGEQLEGFARGVDSRRIIEQACQVNGWFTEHEIVASVEAIRTNMLQPELLAEWIGHYPTSPHSLSVGVVMAGNIPLVGFFDLLCVVMAGHKCLYKPSSKDEVLIDYIVALLRHIKPNIPIEHHIDQTLDAVIATGSDNANRYFRSQYLSIPSVLRANRISVAILSGQESDAQLACLASDIFSYSGLGCRSVSHISTPKGYNVERLIELLSDYRPINSKYLNNFKQHRALLKLTDQPHYAGAHFVLRESNDLPEALSEITYSSRQNIGEILRWIDNNAQNLQCVVSGDYIAQIVDLTTSSALKTVRFGQTQQPSLTDYPDGIDLLQFLTSLNDA